MSIDHINLARLDLNLLIALDALLETSNVTKAGKLMGIGQSAMSHNLGRLRTLFGDELLTRHGGGMRRTPRAEFLRVSVREKLRGIQNLLGRETLFDPGSTERLFKIAVPDSIEMILMPRILGYIQQTAPRIRLRLYNIDPEQVINLLDENRIDIGIGVGPFHGAQTHHKSRLLMRDSYLTLFNSKITGLKTPISLSDFIKFPHILTSLRPGEHGVVDRALSVKGLSRSLALTTPRFMSVAPFLVHAPVIATMHSRPALILAKTFDLTTNVPPIELESVKIEMIWHGSYGDDQAHCWLRNILWATSQTL